MLKKRELVFLVGGVFFGLFAMFGVFYGPLAVLPRLFAWPAILLPLGELNAVTFDRDIMLIALTVAAWHGLAFFGIAILTKGRRGYVAGLAVLAFLLVMAAAGYALTIQSR